MNSFLLNGSRSGDTSSHLQKMVRLMDRLLVLINYWASSVEFSFEMVNVRDCCGGQGETN